MQEFLKEKGLPYFKRLDRPLGGAIYLWFEPTFDPESFITSLMLNNGNPRPQDAECNRAEELVKQEYEGPFGHDTVPLEFYYKRDAGKTNGLVELAVTTTEEEEAHVLKNDFEMVEPSESLSRYGVPGEGTLLWWRRLPKNADKAKAGAALTNLLLKEAAQWKVIRALLTPFATTIFLHSSRCCLFVSVRR